MPFCFPTTYALPEKITPKYESRYYTNYIIADSIYEADDILQSRGLHNEQFKFDTLLNKPIQLELHQYPILRRFSELLEDPEWFSKIDSMIHQACFLSMCALSRIDVKIDPQFILGDESGMHELIHMKHLGPVKKRVCFIWPAFFVPLLNDIRLKSEAIPQWKQLLLPKLRDLEDATIGLFEKH